MTEGNIHFNNSKLYFRGDLRDIHLGYELRAMPGLMVIPGKNPGTDGKENNEIIWLEMEKENMKSGPLMKALLLDGPYIHDAQNGLRHKDRHLADYQFPDTTPIPAEKFFALTPPGIKPARSKNSIIKTDIRLEPSNIPQLSTAIMTEWHHLDHLASHSTGFDMRDLMYAWSTHGIIYIFGKNLPPVRGRNFWSPDNSRIYIPSGYEPKRMLDMEILAGKHLNNSEAHLIFRDECDFELIPGEAIHKLSRSSLRLTSYLSAV